MYKSLFYILLFLLSWFKLEAQESTAQKAFRSKIEQLIEKGELRKAKQLCEQELATAKDGQTRIWASYQLGEMAFSEGDTKSAESYYQKAYQTLISADVPAHLSLEVLQNIIIFYSNIGAHENAMMLLKRSLQIAQQAGKEESIKDIYNQLYSNYYSLGQLDSAVFYFSSLMDFKKTEDSEDMMNDWSVIGKLYTEKGDYVLAQRYLTKALREAELKQDTFFMMSLYTDIASVYAAQKIFTSAYQYAQNGIELARLKSVKLIEAENLKIQGQVLYQQNATQEAIAKYRAALAIFKSLNHTISIANIYLDLGRIYQKNEDYESAVQNIKEALAVRQGTSDAIGILNAKLVEAELELQYNHVGKAIKILEFCLAQSQHMNHESARLQAYLLLSKAYVQQNRYKEGYDFYTKYKTLNDSLTSIERSRMIKEMGILYETEKKDNELALKQAEIEIRENKIRRRNNQLLLVLSVLGLVSLSLILLYISNHRKKLLAEQRFEVMKKEQETQRLRAFIAGEEKERRRIARDLHDDLGALLATVKLRMNAMENEIPKIENHLSYQKATELIDHACSKIREISHNMIPTILDQYGLEYAIGETCEAIEKDHQIEVDFIPFGLEHDIDATMQVNIYRIVQELLRNVVNHAQAKSVIVQLTQENNNINLIVEDDGIGFDPLNRANTGIGLDNIISRVKYLAGEILIDSRPNEGSTFTINIPFINKLVNK